MAKVPPYSFVLEELADLSPITKPMFGAFSVYVDGKIVFILRCKEEHPRDNGVWLATTGEHHSSLQKDFPSMRSIELFGVGVTGWQNLPEEADDFEESVVRACKFIRAGDLRIGKIPKPRSSKKKTIKKKKLLPQRK